MVKTLKEPSKKRLLKKRTEEYPQPLFLTSFSCKYVLLFCGTNRVKSNIIFLIIIILSTFEARGQQDPQFSLNMLNKMSVNPAFSGSEQTLNTYLLNRTQWSGFEGAPKSTIFGADMAINLLNENDGIGLTLISDEIGYFTDVSVNFAYSYRRTVGEGALSFGISIGMKNKQLSPDWEGEFDESDPSIPKTEINEIVFDGGLGIYYSHQKYYAGISVSHLNQASFEYDSNGEFSLKRHYYLTTGYNFTLANPLYVVTPSFYFKSDGVSSQLDLNALVKYKKRYLGGITFRPGDAIVAMAGIELKNGLRFAYAYDIGTSAIANYSDGSHELYLSYSVSLRKNGVRKHKSVRYL